MSRNTAKIHDFRDNIIVFAKLQEMPEEAILAMKKRVREKFERSLHSATLPTAERRSRALFSRTKREAA